MVKFNLAIILILLSFFVAKSQPGGSPIFEDIIPPSPEAAAIAKFGDTPVSYNTGTPNISVPIYQIEGRELSLPISMSYDSKGIKTRDIASWVGLGWTLNAGGIITRTIRGLADEKGNGYFNQYATWELLQNPSYHYTSSDYYNNDRYNFYQDCAQGEIDLVPDAFHFNFGEYSGTLTFARSGDGFTALTSPYYDLKIENPMSGTRTPGAEDVWVFTTPKGIKYTFGGLNKVELSGNVTTAWYLSSIENETSKEKITFSYLPNLDSNGHSTYDISFNPNMVSSVFIPPKNNHQGEPCYYPQTSMSQSEIGASTSIYLFGITYNSNTSLEDSNNVFIEFLSTNNGRCDYQAGFTPPLRKLYNIKIKDSIGLLKSFDLTFSHYGEDCISSKNRLRLDQIQENGLPPYKFEYDNSSLPLYTDMIDHYGYPNGGNSNAGSFIPPLPEGYKTTYHNNSYTSANRESNSTSARGLIKKIIYPTGGWTEFDFEVHRVATLVDNYPVDGYARSVAYSDENNHGEMSTAEQIISQMWDNHEAGGLVGHPANVDRTIFEIEQGQTVQLSASFWPPGNPYGPYAPPTRARLYKNSVSDIYDYVHEFGSTDISKPLAAGKYILVSSVGSNLQYDDVVISASVYYRNLMDDYLVRNTVGGARIKVIRDYDAVTDKVKTTKFYYSKDNLKYLRAYNNFVGIDGNPVEPNYETSHKMHYVPDYFSTDLCGSLYAAANTSNTFGRIRGHHIGYDQVAVEVNGLENGLTIYNYFNSSNPGVRSLLKSVEKYRYDEDLVNYVSIEKTENQYEDFYLRATTAHNIKVKWVQFLAEMDGQKQTMSHFDLNANTSMYSYASFWRAKVAQIDSKFGLNGTSQISNSTFKYFDATSTLAPSQGGYQLLIENKKEVGDDILKTTYIYPPNAFTFPPLNAIEIAYNEMIIRGNYDNLVAKKEELIKSDGQSSTLSKVQYYYNNYNPHLNPEVGYSTKPSSEITFDNKTDESIPSRTFKYDALGNIIEEYSHLSGLYTSYLWDRDGKNVVSKIVNAKHDEVDYCSFEQATSNNWSIGTSGISATATGVKTRLSNKESKSGVTIKTLSSQPGGGVSYTNTLPSGNYKISLFARDGNVIINGVSKTAGNIWERLVFDSDGTPFSIEGTALIDEIRIIPDRSNVFFTSFYIEDNVGLISQVDNNGVTTYYDYDEKSRLINLRNNDHTLMEKIEYSYRLNNE